MGSTGARLEIEAGEALEADGAETVGRDLVTLATAVLVVVVGTASTDLARVWLLAVPASFLFAAYSMGALLEGLASRLAAAPALPAGRPAILAVAVRIGVGLAGFSLLAVTCALFGVFWLTGLAMLAVIAVGLAGLARGRWSRPSADAIPYGAGAGIVLGIAWLIAWLWAMTPPVFFDELAYHLVIPQRALETGTLATLPWIFFTLMPQVGDLLLAWGMALGGDLGARGITFALWVACSMAAWGLVEAMIRPRRPSFAGPAVAAAMATSPTLWFLGTLPFAETALTLAFVTAAAILAGPQRDRRPWVALGLVLGWLASVKLSGMIWVLAALAAALVIRWPWEDVMRAGGIVALSASPWWVRAFEHTGNPIYPMAYGLLGGRYWSQESQARLFGDLPYGNGSLGLGGALALPVDLVRHPDRFGSAADPGPVAVAAVCLVLLLPVWTRLGRAGEAHRRLGDAAALAVLIAGVLWVQTTPTTRFFAPAFLLCLAILAGALLQLPRRAKVVALVMLSVAGLAGMRQFTIEHDAIFSSSRVALGLEAADAYLSRRLDHYAASRFVRTKVPAGAKLLFIGETRPYYFDREAIAPSAYDSHPLQRWVEDSPSTEVLARRIADEGVTHVVLNVREFHRLNRQYGYLAFSGDAAEAEDRRLKDLPRLFRQVFEEHGVYVFEVPSSLASTHGHDTAQGGVP